MEAEVHTLVGRLVERGWLIEDAEGWHLAPGVTGYGIDDLTRLAQHGFH